MAIRTIRLEGDELLRKKSKPVKEITPNVLTLLDDMAETMRSRDGLGLAAPQVGVLKRIVVLNIEGEVAELINPEIVDESGTQNKMEGCLSVPGKMGMVERPACVRVKAQDRYGNEIFLEGEDILAVALCHEIDHLNGVLYIDKATHMEEARLQSDEDDDEVED